MTKPRIIAFYLPQYHPTPNNDKWWGKGFTEWTNVGKAKSLFKGHEQPKVPADLGYYDLRLPEVREAQADMAREAGIEGFCYYHYWFNNDNEELDLPFKEVVRLKQPDFPFCLCWANESWHKKFWNVDGTCEKEILAQQVYESNEGHKKHFYSLLDAFKDERYIRVNGKLLFVIYKPLDFIGIKNFIKIWNDLAIENGLGGFHFIGQTINSSEVTTIQSLGFDAVNCVRLWEPFWAINNRFNFYSLIKRCLRRIYKTPFIVRYSHAIKFFSSSMDKQSCIYPTLIPNWDHTPRSGRGGSVLTHSTPELFKKHVKQVLGMVCDKEQEKNIVFLKSWNEWGEGNYMEPDLIYGKQYINALREALDEAE